MFTTSRFFLKIVLFISIAIPAHAQFLSITLDAPITDPISGDELRLGTAMMLILASDSTDPADLDFSSPFFIGGDDTSLMFSNNVYNPLCYYDQSILAAYGITEYPVCYGGMNIDYLAHEFSSGETISVYARFFNNLSGTAPDGFDMPQQGSFDESGTLRQYMYGDYTDTYYADTELFSLTMPTCKVAEEMFIIPVDFSVEIDTSQLVWEKAASGDDTTAPQLVPYPESTSNPEDDTTPTQSDTPDSSDTDTGSDDSDNSQQPSSSTGQNTETPSESSSNTEGQTTGDTQQTDTTQDQQPDPTSDPEVESNPDTVSNESPDDAGTATTDQELEPLDPEIIEMLDSIEYAGIYIEERPRLQIIDLCTTICYKTTSETQLDGGVPVVPEPGAMFLSAWGFFFIVRHMLRKRS